MPIDRFSRALLERFGQEAREIAYRQVNAASAPDVRASWSAILAKLIELTDRLPTTEHMDYLGDPSVPEADLPGK